MLCDLQQMYKQKSYMILNRIIWKFSIKNGTRISCHDQRKGRQCCICTTWRYNASLWRDLRNKHHRTNRWSWWLQFACRLCEIIASIGFLNGETSYASFCVDLLHVHHTSEFFHKNLFTTPQLWNEKYIYILFYIQLSIRKYKGQSHFPH